MEVHGDDEKMKAIFKIKVTDRDDVTIEATRKQAEMNITFKDMLIDSNSDEYIPSNQNFQNMNNVMKFCIHHNGVAPPEDHYTKDGLSDLEKNEFIDTMSNKELLELINCASYLQNNALLQCCFRALADKARGKTKAEIQNLCCVPDNVVITEEEIEEQKKELLEVK